MNYLHTFPCRWMNFSEVYYKASQKQKYDVFPVSVSAERVRSWYERWALIGCWCSWRNTSTPARWRWLSGSWWFCCPTSPSWTASGRGCVEGAGWTTRTPSWPIRSARCWVRAPSGSSSRHVSMRLHHAFILHIIPVITSSWMFCCKTGSADASPHSGNAFRRSWPSFSKQKAAQLVRLTAKGSCSCFISPSCSSCCRRRSSSSGFQPPHSFECWLKSFEPHCAGCCFRKSLV